MSSPMKFLIIVLINSEVILSVVSHNIDHVRKNVRESKTSLCENELNSPKKLPIYLEFLNQNKSGLEDLVVKQFNTMNSLINKLNECEHHMFEPKNRKLCSLCPVCDKVYNKLRNLPESMSRASPPHLTQNKPLLNNSSLDRYKKLRPHIPEQKIGQLLNDINY
ncbi:putative signal peptide protein [Puccinia sorghi]|uniref:Putative signal peptide protein n=1 Tax=Puccinia sorghi TaxID=27349 RepID=A0A0L6VRL2_9BASI|nr:putative signal peptide protein [Puccinia sorghi]